MGASTGLGLQHKREFTSILAGAANNGLSVDGGTGKIVLGGPQGAAAAAAMLGNREIPSGNFTLSLSGAIKFVLGASAATGNAPLQIVQSLIGSLTDPAIRITETWNTSGTATLILATLTNTASNALSNLIDLTVTGRSRFRIQRDGGALWTGTSTIGGGTNLLYIQFTPISVAVGQSSGAGGQATALAITNSFRQNSGSTQLNAIGIQDQWNPTNGTSDCSGLYISSTINSNINATGNYRGVYFNPTLLVLGGGRLIGYENTIGDNYLNSNAAVTASRTVIGSNAIVASALLNVDSTSQGFLLPRMTTVQKNAIAGPVAGLMVYDSTLNKACIYTGAAWQTITSV